MILLGFILLEQILKALDLYSLILFALKSVAILLLAKVAEIVSMLDVLGAYLEVVIRGLVGVLLQSAGLMALQVIRFVLSFRIGYIYG